MRQRMFLLILLFVLILTKTNDISAKETKLNEDMFTNVENTLKEKEIDVSYTQLVKQLIHGNVKGVLHTIKAKMKEVFLNRMLIQKDLIREILLIAFTAAIFKNLSDSFFQQSTANSAFYITYVILCGVMVHSFFYLNKTVTQLVTLMADYMKGMIMAYSLAVVSTSGITTSTTVYEFYLLLIYAMTTLTNVVLLPMIKILFVLKIINHISKEEHFSRLCKTLEGVIKFLLKGFLSVLLGVQLIQSMILPAVDSMKNTVLQKGMSAIPGIGSGLNSAMTMVIGSAVVIKNSIGAVGILVLIVIIVPPVIEITAVVLTYLLAGIMIQQILKTTVMLLLRNGKVKAKYKDDLKKKMLYFSNVDSVEPIEIKWSSIRFQRNNQTYRMLISICQLIIEGMLITTDAGDYRLASFVDEQRMCRLYEKFILEYYSRHYPELSVSASQIPWALDDGVGTMLPVMQSDIHLQRGNTVLIIDAKYYSRTTQVHFDKHTLHSNNLYQIFTYVKNRSYQFGEDDNIVSGMLLYAKTEEEIQPDNVYQMHGSQISVKTLDLNLPFAEIADQMDGIVESHFTGVIKAD